MLVVLCTLMDSACSRQVRADDGLRIESTISPKPVRMGWSTLTLVLAQRDGTPLRDAGVSVEADMSHAGMAPVFSDASESVPGTYQAALNLTMPGDWVLLLHVHPRYGGMLERQIEVKDVRAK
jgi:YtkA-like